MKHLSNSLGKGALAAFLVITLSIGFSATAKAITFDELFTLVNELKTEIVQLKSQMQATALQATSMGSGALSARSTTIVPVSTSALTAVTAQTAVAVPVPPPADVPIENNIFTTSGVVTTSTPVQIGVVASSLSPASIGQTGSNVLAIQKVLIDKGYLSADSATGYFGVKTQGAVKAFQAASGLTTVGNVGNQTIAALTLGGKKIQLPTAGKVFVLAGSRNSLIPQMSTVSVTSDGVNYTAATTTAPWGLQTTEAVYFNNALWVVGGLKYTLNTNTSAPSNAVWKSNDNGVTWSPIDTNNGLSGIQNPPWNPRHNHKVLVFNNKMWVLGGLCYTGQQANHCNDVWSSVDGVLWTHVDSNPMLPGIQNAQWQPRIMSGAGVHNGKMWVLGGQGTGFGIDYHDVWSTSDGVTWTMVNANSPVDFQSKFVVHNGKMYLLGVNTNYTSGNKNVYSSIDGVTWTLLTSTAPFATHTNSLRYGYEPFSFNGKIWILGGENEIFMYEDIWSSSDGITWTQSLNMMQPFLPAMGTYAVAVVPGNLPTQAFLGTVGGVVSQ